MTRTLLIENVFNYNNYYTSEVITVVDLLTNEPINIRADFSRTEQFRGINSDLVIITVQPWRMMNVTDDKSAPNELVFHNIRRAGITRRTEVKHRFPEYFI